MTDLSPAAQAVKNAVLALYPDKVTQDIGWPLDIPTIAAALRTAADQVVPLTPKPDDTFCCPPVETIVWKSLVGVRHQLLAIAAELETSTIENR